MSATKYTMARATLSPTDGFWGFHMGRTTPSAQLASSEQFLGGLVGARSEWSEEAWDRWVRPRRTTRREVDRQEVKGRARER